MSQMSQDRALLVGDLVNDWTLVFVPTKVKGASHTKRGLAHFN